MQNFHLFGRVHVFSEMGPHGPIARCGLLATDPKFTKQDSTCPRCLQHVEGDVR